MATLRWGLIPGWARDARIAFQCVNARSETVASKPAFALPFSDAAASCPQTDSLEWKAAGSAKQPWRFTRPDEGLMGSPDSGERWTPGRADPGGNVHRLHYDPECGHWQGSMTGCP